ncbi:hypothetical protein TVAG_431890 [Trichomonas vaginalis G3]|uniref:DUF3447 domain-containing protein n=1 Tax=Trichomonas vaginalis (strain ATCC PRA-98 / G3) TaxID=412133 RepID=A2F7Y6_TRIV3|nr:protein ubiquitination [Trichomonas vaginalis G3]EAX98980.1 hypothetical protein TVAG_431890 [Trichomonas vaginalis G3]KAI5507236.1 protein ubiquitination [Trichomonas vaginalis G3]|eukprot:XP_001311910.1 hypothetical protein [Trichomonas vaginalis G3]
MELATKIAEEYHCENNLHIKDESPFFKALINDNLGEFISLTNGGKETSTLTLQFCCRHGAINCFNYLRSERNITIDSLCLCNSFIGGNLDIIKECLKYKEPDYDDAVEYAIFSHDLDLINFLRDNYHLEISPYYCAMHVNLEAFLLYYEKTHNINKCFKYSPGFGIPSLCEFSLLNLANINSFDFDGNALHCAIKYNHIDIAKYIILHGIDMNYKVKLYQTPLLYALSHNKKDFTKLLVNSGANTNILTDEFGQSALHYAIINEDQENAALLIWHGSNVNAKNQKSGATALHFASLLKNKELLDLLISNGINVDTKDYYGNTALMISLLFNFVEHVNFYKSFSGHFDYRESTNNKNSTEVVEFLIAKGDDVNVKNNQGNTPLHLVSLFSDIIQAKYLISQNAKINEVN